MADYENSLALHMLRLTPGLKPLQCICSHLLEQKNAFSEQQG